MVALVRFTNHYLKTKCQAFRKLVYEIFLKLAALKKREGDRNIVNILGRTCNYDFRQILSSLWNMYVRLQPRF